MHGVTTDTNAPERNPYTTANAMSGPSDAVSSIGIQNARHERPEKKVEGKRRLNRPRRSERYAGAMRPRMPPALSTART